MTNPTNLVSNFAGTLTARTQSSTTSWTVDAGDEEYTTGPPQQFEATGADSDQLSMPTSGVIDSLVGSIAMRFTRLTDTGAGTEPILEAGENTAGYDHLQIFIDGDTLWVAWDSNGALPQTIDTGQTMTVDQTYFIYTYWEDLIFGVSIDNGTPIVAVREVPTGDWGTNPLIFEAS